MGPSDWESIKRIFESAVRLRPEDRQTYLESACSACPHLRPTVEELLANHEAAGSFLDVDETTRSMSRMFEPGQVVAGRFRLVRFIAQGGMGEVYEAFDERLSKRVALKTMRREFLNDLENLERFRREVWVMTEVSHSGICRVYDMVEHRIPPPFPGALEGVVPCLTMELLEGVTLQQKLQRQRPLPRELVLDIMRQVTEALDLLHSRGIVHRDLKPSNIMLQESDEGVRAVLTDFGLARPLEAGGGRFRSASDVVVGAPYFLAPEIIRGGRPSVASDIYSLGLVLDEMVSRSSAYPSKQAFAIYQEKLFGQPVPLAERSENLPPHWPIVIERCTHADPGVRYTDASRVYHDLSGTRAQPWPWLKRKLLRRALILAGIALPLLLIGLLITAVVSARVDAIVVLYPVENASGNPDWKYLASGLEGALEARLKKVPGFTIHHVASPRIRPAAAQKPQFGVLGVISRNGDQVRATLRVVDPITGDSLWSGHVDRTGHNDLAMQDQICDLLLVELRSGLMHDTPLKRQFRGLTEPWLDAGGPHLPELTGNTSNAEAYNAYIRGRDLYEQRTISGARQATEFLNRAIVLDPNYAMPYAVLADVQRLMMDYNLEPHTALLERAEQYARRSLDLAPELPEGHLALAAIHQMQWDWQRARAQFESALRLTPLDSIAHYRYAGLLLQTGAPDEALRRARYAVSLDPLYAPNIIGYGYMLLLAGRSHDCIVELEGLLKRQDAVGARTILGQAYATLAGPASGEAADVYLRKALQQAEILRGKENSAARASSPVLKFPELISALAFAYHGDPSRALPHLQLLEQGMAAGTISPAVVAEVHAVLGNASRALDLLDRAAETKDRAMLNIKVSPYYIRLRTEARMGNLLQKMGLR